MVEPFAKGNRNTKKKYQQVLSTLRSINREDKFFEKNKLKHFVWGGSVKGDPLRQAGTSSKTIANCFVWWMTSGEGQSWYLGKVDSASNVPVAGGIHAWFHWSLPRFNSSIRLYPEPIMPQLPTWVGTSTPNQKLELQTASPKKKSNQKHPQKNLAAKTHRNPPQLQPAWTETELAELAVWTPFFRPGHAEIKTLVPPWRYKNHKIIHVSHGQRSTILCSRI